jgi:hypothetical protein
MICPICGTDCEESSICFYCGQDLLEITEVVDYTLMDFEEKIVDCNANYSTNRSKRPNRISCPKCNSNDCVVRVLNRFIPNLHIYSPEIKKGRCRVCGYQWEM